MKLTHEPVILAVQFFMSFFLSWPLVNSIVLRRLVFSGPKNGSIISREQDEKKKKQGPIFILIYFSDYIRHFSSLYLIFLAYFPFYCCHYSF